MRRSERFYRGVIGATSLPSDTVPRLALGSVQISLLPNATAPTPARFPDHAMVWLWIEVDDLPEIHQRCLDANVPIPVPPTDGMSMQIEDPDGLIVEIWQRSPD